MGGDDRSITSENIFQTKIRHTADDGHLLCATSDFQCGLESPLVIGYQQKSFDVNELQCICVGLFAHVYACGTTIVQKLRARERVHSIATDRGADSAERQTDPLRDWTNEREKIHLVRGSIRTLSISRGFVTTTREPYSKEPELETIRQRNFGRH